MNDIDRQLRDTTATLVSLQNFQASVDRAVKMLKLQDLEATTKIVEATIVVATREGLHPGVMLEAALREKLAILDAVREVAGQMEGVVYGIVRWADIAEANAALKALAYPQSADGRLRQRFEHLPCFIQSKGFYDACQTVVDAIANTSAMASIDMSQARFH